LWDGRNTVCRVPFVTFLFFFHLTSRHFPSVYIKSYDYTHRFILYTLAVVLRLDRPQFNPFVFPAPIGVLSSFHLSPIGYFFKNFNAATHRKSKPRPHPQAKLPLFPATLFDFALHIDNQFLPFLTIHVVGLSRLRA
jgi:hypothetical protein